MYTRIATKGCYLDIKNITKRGITIHTDDDLTIEQKGLILWNDFHDFTALHKLPVHAQLLWYKLYDRFERNGFELDVPIKDSRLLDLMGTTCLNTLYNSRKRLQAEGFLVYYTPQNRGALSMYSLTPRHVGI